MDARAHVESRAREFMNDPKQWRPSHGHHDIQPVEPLGELAAVSADLT
jgi:hypothetical protein